MEVAGRWVAFLSQGWRLKTVFVGEEAEVGYAQVAGESAWGASGAEGEELVVAFED